jgi:hypothetical protein
VKNIIFAALALLSFTAQCGVTIYKDRDLNGPSAFIADGEMIDGLWERRVFENDSVTSLRVDYGSCAVLYQNSGFNGKALFFSGSQYSVPDLSFFPYGFNDETSSIQVFKEYHGPCDSSSMAIFYYDANYKNIAFYLPPGGSLIRDLSAGNWNRRNGRLQHADNAISSVSLPSGYCVVLSDNANFLGQSITLTYPTPDLVLNNFNDKASSVRLVPCN